MDRAPATTWRDYEHRVVFWAQMLVQLCMLWNHCPVRQQPVWRALARGGQHRVQWTGRLQQHGGDSGPQHAAHGVYMQCGRMRLLYRETGPCGPGSVVLREGYATLEISSIKVSRS